MAERTTSGFWSLAAGLVLAGSLASIMDAGQVQGVQRACCFANGTCAELSRSICEDQQGGISQMVGQNCTVTECPVLCGGSAPECNGACDGGNTTCVDVGINGTVGMTNGNGHIAVCGCIPAIPQGGSCEEFPTACAGALPCENGVCCATVCPQGQDCNLPGSVGVCAAIAAPVPTVSSTGLLALVAVLIAAGGLTLMRRRSQTGA
ncbi:MAG: hypothetical protein ACRERC_03055 [Candidatus Binatia bacterium]